MAYYRKNERHLIENYELALADNFKGWCIHHRDEYKVLPSGIEVWRTKQELIADDRYYNCPANELIYMRIVDHQAYHMKHISPDRRKNMSLKAKGSTKRTPSLATRKKLSDAKKGKSCPWAAEVGKAYTGMTWKVINGKRVWLPKEINSHEAE